MTDGGTLKSAVYLVLTLVILIFIVIPVSIMIVKVFTADNVSAESLSNINAWIVEHKKNLNDCRLGKGTCTTQSTRLDVELLPNSPIEVRPPDQLCIKEDNRRYTKCKTYAITEIDIKLANDQIAWRSERLFTITITTQYLAESEKYKVEIQ